MATEKHLRAATEDDAPASHKTIYEASEAGTRLDQLISLRRRIANFLDADDVQGRDLAALSKRLMDLTKEIEELEVQAQEEALDSEVRDSDISTAWRPEAI